VGAVTPAVRRSCATDVFDPALKAAAFGVVDTGGEKRGIILLI
jgi:hypothetical protein